MHYIDIAEFAFWMLKDNLDKKMARQIQAKKQRTGYSIRSMQYDKTQYEIAGMGGDDGRIVSPTHPSVIPAKAGIQKGGKDVPRK